MPRAMCLEAGCPNHASTRGRCAEHANRRERTINRSGRALYKTKRWLLLRRSVLFNEPLCRECGSIAQEVDHIVPLEQGGAPLSRSNCQPLCKEDHSKKTRREQMA